MASSALSCPVRQVLVHVYPGSSKAWSEPRVTVPIGRRGRPVQKPRLMPLHTALSVARKLQAAQAASWRGPAGPRSPWTFAMARTASLRSRCLGGEGAGKSDRAGRWMPPRWGRRAAALLGFPWFPQSPLASSFSRWGLIAAGCGCGCSIALASPQRAVGWCCAARACGGCGSCRWLLPRKLWATSVQGEHQDVICG